MQFNSSLFVTALGLAFVIEGVPYFLFAEKMPRFLALLAGQGSKPLRFMGLIAMLAGSLLIWLASS
ncbi:MAG: DUF2065 domain-containing protein [Proteobacteria bacterium]|nr:DUF2065 domain-containing protein [Pseudomonadota bacterium]MBU1612421.1 DUF2065 domain-containing protein [Pseudomonadota bacterium]